LLVRYRGTDYSVPTAYGHREVVIRGYVHEVVISCGAEVIARHPRSYERDDFVFNPLHYLALLEQKIGALDQAAPLVGWAIAANGDVGVGPIATDHAYETPQMTAYLPERMGSCPAAAAPQPVARWRCHRRGSAGSSARRGAH